MSHVQLQTDPPRSHHILFHSHPIIARTLSMCIVLGQQFCSLPFQCMPSPRCQELPLAPVDVWETACDFEFSAIFHCLPAALICINFQHSIYGALTMLSQHTTGLEVRRESILAKILLNKVKRIQVDSRNLLIYTQTETYFARILVD